MRPKFLDFSWQRPSAGDLAAVDRDARTYNGVVLPPPGWFDDCDRADVGVILIFETTSERAQEGYQAGAYDAQFSSQRARQVGRAGIHTVFVVSDGNSRQPEGNDRVADYGEAIARTYDGPIEFYGNRSCIDWATAGARRVPEAKLVAGPNGDGGWIPVTWGVDLSRDTAGQEANTPPPLDGTDENTLYYDPGTDPEEDDDMADSLLVQHQDHPEWGIWVFTANTRRHMLPDEWQWVHDVNAYVGKPPPVVVPVTNQWWGTFPDIVTLVDPTGPPLPPIVVPCDIATFTDVELTAEVGRRLAT